MCQNHIIFHAFCVCVFVNFISDFSNRTCIPLQRLIYCSVSEQNLAVMSNYHVRYINAHIVDYVNIVVSLLRVVKFLQINYNFFK